MIDLDSFKLVNDLYGHKMGDNILICFAAILRNALPEHSKIGRIGGDEFIAFATEVQTQEAVAEITAQINSSLVAKAKELMGEDMDIPLGASVGGVFVPMHGDNYDDLFKLADKSLYAVKKNGKHGFSLYQPDDAAEENAAVFGHDISKLSEILGERSIPNVALQLDREAFSYVYRYIMRSMVRNQQCIYKVLFTLRPENDTDEHNYKDLCDDFGNHIRESLRKTDILMRSRFNQYFVLLTDIKKNDIDIVTGNIMRRWKLNGGSGLDVTYETEYVSFAGKQQQKIYEFHLALVDDDEPTLRQAGTLLSKAGYRVSAMKSGKSLLKFLADHTPDVILLDMQMPDMDGCETMKQLRNISSAARIPVIFLTENDADETERTALALGAEDLLRKPLLQELLLHRVRRIAELAELRRIQRGISKS